MSKNLGFIGLFVAIVFKSFAVCPPGTVTGSTFTLSPGDTCTSLSAGIGGFIIAPPPVTVTPMGATAIDGGRINFQGNGTIDVFTPLTNGAVSSGVTPRISLITFTSSQVIVNNGTGAGFLLQDGGQIFADNTTSITINNGGTGILLDSTVSLVTIAGITINLNGSNGIGVHSTIQTGTTPSNLVIIGLTVQGSGAQIGLEADSGSQITASSASITVNGQNGAAVDLSGGSVFPAGGIINLGGTNALALGPAQAAARARFGTAANPNVLNVAGGSLIGESSTAILAESAFLDVNLSRGAQVIGGNGFLVQALSTFGPPSVVNLSATTTTLPSNVLVGSALADAASTLNMSIEDQTQWTGAALNVTNLAIDQTSVWNLTANSTISNQLMNAGLINFIPQGNVFKSLTVGSYIGQNGTINLNTFLGGDGSPSDLLIINGGSATGTTFLNIKNTNGTGALTVGNGILIVDAINGGTTAVDSFILANPNDLIIGPFEYDLFRGSVDASAPQNWFLRSMFRPEVSLFTALPSLVLLYQRALADTLHQRVGEEERWCCQYRCQARSFLNGFWARVINEGGFNRGRGILNHGPNFHYNILAGQAGVDIYGKEYCDGSQDYAGILGAIGRAHGRVRHFTHVNVGRNRFNAYTGGLYWTHFGPFGWYLDGVVEGNWYRRVRARPVNPAVAELKTRGSGFSVSVEGGYPFQFNYFILEPQAQVVFQRIRFHDTTGLSANIEFRRTKSAAGRLGLRLFNAWCWGRLASKQPRQITAWARASIWHDWQGNSRTFFSSETGPTGVSSRLRGSWMQGDLGITAQLTDIFTFYATGGGNVYFNRRGEAYNVTAGVRANF